MFKVLETFSGIGAQAKALERIGEPFEIAGTSDWDIHSILAYCLIHQRHIDSEKFGDLPESLILDELKKLHLSFDGKQEMSQAFLSKLPDDLKRKILAAARQTENYGSILNIRGSDLPSDIDLLTYTFPCQDVSLARSWHGTPTGISKKAHNHSGLLWEIERILLEMKESNVTLPRFLMMENVAAINSKKYEEDFTAWKEFLEDLGYVHIKYRLKAENFGIPQIRERFYLVSIKVSDINNEIRKKIHNHLFEYSLDVFPNAYTDFKEASLSDFLKIDYTVDKYRIEAESCQANDTVSRQKIYNNNIKLVTDGHVNDVFVKTLTTKQDRNPNSGVIDFDNPSPGKADWRYLTPRECFLLMGFDEEDYEILAENDFLLSGKQFFSRDNLYKLAGNSVVVNVLEQIFRQIQFIDKNFIKK